MIDAESQTPQANDQKMVKQLHRAFEKHECMLKPHPKDAASTFIIRHYAGEFFIIFPMVVSTDARECGTGAVVYTVGRFIEKNADRLPKEVRAYSIFDLAGSILSDSTKFKLKFKSRSPTRLRSRVRRW